MAAHDPVSYKGLLAASTRATLAARGASRKTGSRPELELRRAMWRLGLRYRVDASDLPGRPDVAFPLVRVVVFCDGDFWHGRDIEKRLQRLAGGHNAPYWVAKIRGNVERDKLRSAELEREGWLVLRFWEGDIRRDAKRIAELIRSEVAARRSGSKRGQR